MEMPANNPNNAIHLNRMASNIQDILESVSAIHGPKYHDLLICLFGGMAAVTQLTTMATDAIDFLMTDKSIPENARTVASSNKPIITLNSDNYIKSMHHVCSILESEHGMKDMGKNLAALMDRVENDFMRHIDRSTKP